MSQGTRRGSEHVAPLGLRCMSASIGGTGMTENNVHAHHEEAVAPNCSLGPVWCRDAADGRPIVALLHRLARRRGVARVKAAVLRWLREVE